MKEVQQILKGPSCHAVKQLQSLKRETEIAVRYGCPGVIMYNFSKTLGWNQASSSQLPSLQLRSFRTTKEEIQLASASISPLPFSPITWLVLPQQPAPVQLPSMNDDGDGMQEKRPSSPISEPGGWRDTDQIEDIADMRLEPFLGIAVSARNVAITDDDDEEDEDLEGEFCPHEDDVVSTACEKQAIPVKIIPVFSGQVRQVRIRNIK
ncbi:hypothetical protein RRF57_000073 [Xylaria bambusicola]|uniref:Uncharacterized protein n=1 Tax=Xylaria bambusicola TaxID=326684 RepID=A0AAN7UBJ0_9PEZI